MRIFTAIHGTQLLVVQHLRHHLRLPPAREFLAWYPIDNSRFVDDFMQPVIAEAGFEATLDMRDFTSLQPRTHGTLAWSLESVRRLRRDAAAFRHWMERQGIVEGDVELWADDPIHFYVCFCRGLLATARHVKIPHCFNLEDLTIPAWKERLEAEWHDVPWLKRNVFLPWQRWAAGVDLRIERIAYDRAYSFDQPSPWAAESIDVSELISLDAFAETYNTLPATTRQEVEAILAPLRSGPRPLVLLLLFGLTPQSRQAYQRDIARIFAQRGSELAKGCLAVKVHPGSCGPEEEAFIAWLEAHVPARILAIRHPLNLEFILPQLRPDYVWAGPCGAIPILKRIKVSRPIALPEITEELCQTFPQERDALLAVLEGLEVW